jgi:hypothetical protein
MASFSISYWDWIKFPYYADTTEKGDRGWKQAQRQGEDTVTLGILKSITLKKILKSYHTKGLRASQSSCDSTLFTKLQCYRVCAMSVMKFELLSLVFLQSFITFYIKSFF